MYGSRSIRNTDDSIHSVQTQSGVQVGMNVNKQKLGSSPEYDLDIVAQVEYTEASSTNIHGTGFLESEFVGVGATVTWQSTDNVYIDAQALIGFGSVDFSSSLSGDLAEGVGFNSINLGVEVGQEISVAEGSA